MKVSKMLHQRRILGMLPKDILGKCTFQSLGGRSYKTHVNCKALIVLSFKPKFKFNQSSNRQNFTKYLCFQNVIGHTTLLPRASMSSGPAKKNEKGTNPEFDILEEKSRNTDQSPVSMKKRFIVVGVVLAIWGGVYLAAQYMKNKKKIVEREEQLSKVDIGAKDYELIDHTGQTRTKADFLGKWLLLYFGFTHCPDICPEELEKMAEIIDEVAANKSIPDLQPIFISVDPDRDTPEIVGKYVAEFHPKFIGLTGTKEQVKQAAKAFRVYFSAGPKDEDNDYIVDHTIVMYLMNPKGMFVDYYGSRGTPNADIVAGITNNMKNYERLHGR